MKTELGALGQRLTALERTHRDVRLAIEDLRPLTEPTAWRVEPSDAVASAGVDAPSLGTEATEAAEHEVTPEDVGRLLRRLAALTGGRRGRPAGPDRPPHREGRSGEPTSMSA